jgi:SEC-C motif domain protein
MNTEIQTPEELMRSRYDAFVREDWEYLAKTSVHQTIEELSAPTLIQWLKLDVLASIGDTVEFKAYYRANGSIHVMHEKSTFIKEDGVWKYLEGKLFNSKIERNENCPCGSGKKFKKCCG